MSSVVEVSIPVEAHAAAALADARTRAAVGRVISRMLRPHGDADPLVAAMERLSADAERRGLTSDIIQEELNDYNSERRGPGRPSA